VGNFLSGGEFLNKQQIFFIQQILNRVAVLIL
jgi:hypothetical protein